MSRLSPKQLEDAQKRATEFQKRLVQKAAAGTGTGKEKGTGEPGQGSIFFTKLFRLAGEAIERDVDGFCDRAEEVFEEIEAHGQEPKLDEDWLGKIVGDRDTFNFSIDSLVSDLVTRLRKQRGKKPLSQEDRDRLTAEVEAAIINEEPQQNFEQAIAVAHAENVQDSIEVIRQVLESYSGILEFWRLQKKTGLRPTELFLGLLLGQQHWTIRQETFYGKVTVGIRRPTRQKGKERK